MISYSQFKQEVLSDRVAKVVYKGDQMTIFGERLDGTRFETTSSNIQKDESVDNAIEDNGVITVFESVEQPSIWSQLLSWSFSNHIPSWYIFLFYATNARWHVWKGGPMAFGKSKS